MKYLTCIRLIAEKKLKRSRSRFCDRKLNLHLNLTRNPTRSGRGGVLPSWINTVIWSMPNERYTYRGLRTQFSFKFYPHQAVSQNLHSKYVNFIGHLIVIVKDQYRLSSMNIGELFKYRPASFNPKIRHPIIEKSKWFLQRRYSQ